MQGVANGKGKPVSAMSGDVGGLPLAEVHLCARGSLHLSHFLKIGSSLSSCLWVELISLLLRKFLLVFYTVN